MSRYQLPTLLILIGYIIGIMLAKHTQVYTLSLFSQIGLAVVFITALVSLGLSLSKYRLSIKRASGFALVAIVIVGFYRTVSYNELGRDNHFSYFKSTQWHSGTIQDLPVTGKSIKFELSINHSGNHLDSLSPSSGNLLTYLPIDRESEQLKQGDIILIKANIRAIRDNANPRVFDYKAYLANRNIHYQAFVKAEDWLLIGEGGLPYFYQLASRARDFSLRTITTYIQSTDNQAVASAMILGIRSLISDELYDAYTDTGAVHVLAVSGLHVSIISSMILFFLTRSKRNTPMMKGIQLIIVLSLIWGFVLLTGAAPAVKRAAWMFTLFFIGKIFNKDTNIYNVLSLSALLMLVYSPYMLFQASFQFSFLALWSIVFFVPVLSRYISSPNKILNYGIGLIIVATAAQVLVAPLTIYFFHKFAKYFWLSGLFVVVLAYGVLGLGISLIGFEAVGLSILNSNIVAPILNTLLCLFNWIITTIQQIPNSSADGLWLDDWVLVLLYVAIGCFMIFVSRQRKSYLFVCLSCFTLFLGSQLIRKSTMHNSNSLYVYDVYGSSLIDIMHGKSNTTLKSKNLTSESEYFIATNNRAYHGIVAQQYVDSGQVEGGQVTTKENFFAFDGYLFMYAGHDSIYQYKSTVPVDVAIIQDDYIPDIHKLREYYDIRSIIVDGTNSYDIKTLVRKECYKYKIPFHDTQYGAYTMTF